MSNFEINIVFFGNGVRGEQCLKQLIRGGKSIKLVVGQKSTAKIASIAEESGIPFISPQKVNNQVFADILSTTKANLFILCGYNKILKPIILDLPQYKVINCHGGKLPEYRGTAPINWQLINGEKEIGFCILYADKGIDTGEIIRQHKFLIDENTNAEDLVNYSLEWFPINLLEIINEVESEGKLVSTKQDENKSVHYTRRYPEDGRIYWNNMTDQTVHNLVRALVKPYPGAFSLLNDQKVIIKKSKVLKEEFRGVPGYISLKTDDGAIVNCMNRSILIEEIEIDGQTLKATNYFKIGQKFS